MNILVGDYSEWRKRVFECVFKTDLYQSLICETPNCTYKSEGNDTIKRFDLPVELQETRTTQTVSSLLNQYKHIHGTFASDYKCDGCKKVGTCTKLDQISEVSDVLIINLLIFKYDKNTHTTRKIFPNLKIDNEINDFRVSWK